MSTLTSSSIANTATTTSPATLETFSIDADHSEVGFSVRHMLSRTRGRFAAFSGEVRLDRQRPERSSVTFEVQAASIDTRQSDRDTHLRSGDFFDSERHPLIRFTSSSVRPLSGDRYRVSGDLELRGIRKAITLEVSFLGVARDPWGNDRAGFSTQVVLDRKEFGMVWNAALDNGGFILGDDVSLTIDLETVRKS